MLFRSRACASAIRNRHFDRVFTTVLDEFKFILSRNCHVRRHARTVDRRRAARRLTDDRPSAVLSEIISRRCCYAVANERRVTARVRFRIDCNDDFRRVFTTRCIAADERISRQSNVDGKRYIGFDADRRDPLSINDLYAHR